MILAGLLCALVLCVAAFAFILPRISSSGAIVAGHLGPKANATLNVTNPATTIGQSEPGANQTSPYGANQSQTTTIFNYSNYVQQLINPGATTTTILYAYCVGAPLPPFNQSYYSQLDASGADSWKVTTGYPIPFLDGSCASTGGTVYCLGGSSIISGNHTRQAYYASVSSSGIGQWKATTGYPVPFSSGSCAAYNGYIYCVGTANQSDSRDVFYAPVSAGGIGQWRQTTSYPSPFYGAGCSAYRGYIYCLGDAYYNATAIAAYMKGLNGTSNIANQILAGGGLSQPSINYNYYAPISASGVGQWKQITATPIPISGGSCTVSGATLYCVGGSSASLAIGAIGTSYKSFNSSGNGASLISQLVGNDTSAAFYAPIGGNGAVGSWSATAPYPAQLQSAQCASNGGNIYCIGGGNSPQSVFYSALSPALGIEGWLQTTDYPLPFYSGYCSTNSGA